MEKALVRLVMKKLMVTHLVELHDHVCKSRNLKKDKHCNTHRSGLYGRCGQTQSSSTVKIDGDTLGSYKKAPKGPSDSEKTRFSGLMKPQFQASCLKETSSAHHLQSTHPK